MSSKEVEVLGKAVVESLTKVFEAMSKIVDAMKRLETNVDVLTKQVEKNRTAISILANNTTEDSVCVQLNRLYQKSEL